MIIAEPTRRYAGRIFSREIKGKRWQNEREKVGLAPLFENFREGMSRMRRKKKKRSIQYKREKERERLCPREAFFIVCPRSISSPKPSFSSSFLFIFFVGILCLVGKYLNDTILRLLLHPSYDKDTHQTTSRFSISRTTVNHDPFSRIFIFCFFFIDALIENSRCLIKYKKKCTKHWTI